VDATASCAREIAGRDQLRERFLLERADERCRSVRQRRVDLTPQWSVSSLPEARKPDRAGSRILELACERQTDRSGLDGMEMAVHNAADRLAGQSRQIIVFDLAGPCVEQIQHVELHPYAVVEPVAGSRVENEG